MAYFPNGTAGMCYEEQYCANCVHFNGPNDASCQILLIHGLYNYDQCDDTPKGKAVEVILDCLIPRTKDDLGNEQCSMFVEHEEPEEAAADRRRLAEQASKYRAIMAVAIAK